MITGIRVPNCKILRKVEVPISERLTVIVGPNGSGKSTLLSWINVATSGLPPEESEFQGAVTLDGMASPSSSKHDHRIDIAARSKSTPSS